MAAAHCLDLGDLRSVQLAVIALAEPGIEADRDARAAEGDLGRLHGAAQVGRGDGRDAVVPAPRAELGSGLPSRLRQLAGQPARGHAALVVGRDRVRLVDELDHGRLTRGRAACT